MYIDYRRTVFQYRQAHPDLSREELKEYATGRKAWKQDLIDKKAKVPGGGGVRHTYRPGLRNHCRLGDRVCKSYCAGCRDLCKISNQRITKMAECPGEKDDG